MKKVLLLYLSVPLLFALVLFCNCSHYYYVPNTQHVPLFKDKNEYRFSAAYAEGDESSCGEFQAAYSVTGNMGIMANFMTAKGGEKTNADYAHGNYFEGAAGYFKPVSKYGVFEIYGGIGKGSENHTYYDSYYKQPEGDASLSLVKIFIQPAFGVTFNALDVALSTRISSLSFSNIHNNIYGNSVESNRLHDLDQKMHLFFEPALTLRGGWKYVKVQLQASYSGYMNTPRLDFGEEYHLSAGAYIIIKESYKKTKPK